MKNLISIGIPTYNGYERLKELLTSIYIFTPETDSLEVSIIDDGTPYPEEVKKIASLQHDFPIKYSRNVENKGIPSAWNSLVRDSSGEFVVLLNDDVKIINSNWLKAGLYFLQNNHKIGSVGWPLIQMNPETGLPLEEEYWKGWGNKPGRVGSPVGTCFMFRKAVWSQVKNPDGSIGFCPGLKTFHEEILFNLKLWELGYSCWMLHWPPLEHWSSRTFSLNSELTWVEFDDWYGGKEEFWSVIEKSKIIPEDWKEELRVKLFSHNLVDRMSYSRWIFAKMWNVLDSYDDPCKAVDEKIVRRDSLQEIKWLDSELEIRKAKL